MEATDLIVVNVVVAETKTEAFLLPDLPTYSLVDLVIAFLMIPDLLASLHSSVLLVLLIEALLYLDLDRTSP